MIGRVRFGTENEQDRSVLKGVNNSDFGGEMCFPDPKCRSILCPLGSCNGLWWGADSGNNFCKHIFRKIICRKASLVYGVWSIFYWKNYESIFKAGQNKLPRKIFSRVKIRSKLPFCPVVAESRWLKKKVVVFEDGWGGIGCMMMT